MDYNYCSRCKRVYTVGSMNLCGDCLKEIDECMKVIREYLDENPGANIHMVSKGTGVDERDILYLLRQERLELASAELTCDSCGTPIEKGRYCNECQHSMERQFAGLAKSMAQKRGLDRPHSSNDIGNRMQVLDKYKKN